jgi:hypothetical protein
MIIKYDGTKRAYYRTYRNRHGGEQLRHKAQGTRPLPRLVVTRAAETSGSVYDVDAPHGIDLQLMSTGAWGQVGVLPCSVPLVQNLHTQASLTVIQLGGTS